MREYDKKNLVKIRKKEKDSFVSVRKTIVKKLLEYWGDRSVTEFCNKVGIYRSKYYRIKNGYLPPLDELSDYVKKLDLFLIIDVDKNDNRL